MWILLWTTHDTASHLYFYKGAHLTYSPQTAPKMHAQPLQAQQIPGGIILKLPEQLTTISELLMIKFHYCFGFGLLSLSCCKHGGHVDNAITNLLVIVVLNVDHCTYRSSWIGSPRISGWWLWECRAPLHAALETRPNKHGSSSPTFFYPFSVSSLWKVGNFSMPS